MTLHPAGQDAKVSYMAAPRSEGPPKAGEAPTAGASPVAVSGMDPPGVGAVKGAARGGDFFTC